MLSEPGFVRILPLAASRSFLHAVLCLITLGRSEVVKWGDLKVIKLGRQTFLPHLKVSFQPVLLSLFDELVSFLQMSLFCMQFHSSHCEVLTVVSPRSPALCSFHLVVVLGFRDTILLCSLSWLEAHCVDQASVDRVVILLPSAESALESRCA